MITPAARTSSAAPDASGIADHWSERVESADWPQVIEPAAWIGHRPTVELGLHLRYPAARPCGQSGQGTGIHRRTTRWTTFL
jgi:hypothetical protein